MILASTLPNTLPPLAALAYVVWAWSWPTLSVRANRWALAVVWALHLWVLHTSFTADPPSFGFALALSVTLWWVFSIYAWESRLHASSTLRGSIAGLSALAIVLAWWIPGTVHPQLQSAWLPVHWALGFASYGLIAAAVVHAGVLQRTEQQLRHGQDLDQALPLLTLERLTFRFVGMGFVLLSATVLAGWGFSTWLEVGFVWNHKTIFTVLSWLTMGVLLWGRWRWGWRGRLAVRMLYAAAGLLLLGYVGSRFVLDIVLQRLS
jgi:ABC-type uncharacterized transport system permease subunit